MESLHEGSRRRWFALLFALTCFVSANSFLNVNAVSRLGLSHAVANGRLTIDDVARFTVDKAYWQGHFYCDKAPGFSLLCVPASFVADRVADVMGLPQPLLQRPPFKGTALARFALHAYACFIVTSLLFGAMAVYAFTLALERSAVDRRAAALTTVALAFGSPLFVWSTTLLGHGTGTALLFLGFATSFWRPPWPEPVQYAIAGLLLSLAMLVDLTTTPPGLFVALYLMLTGGERRAGVLARRGAWLFVGALPAGFTLAVYNWLAFGSPAHLGYASVAGFAGMKRGFFGLATPSPHVLYEITLGSYRGLVWVSPISLVALASLLLPWPGRYRALFALTAAIAAYYLLLNSSYFYWTGGVSFGPRHITPMIPFVLFAFAFRLTDCGPRTMAAAAALIALSVAMTLVGVSIKLLVPEDGLPMWTGHLLPRFAHIGGNFLLERLGFPALLLAAVQWILALRAAALLLRPAFRDPRPTAA